MDIHKDWKDMSDPEKKRLEEQWSEEPGMIDHVIAHLIGTQEEISAAVSILTRIKEKAGSDLWLNTSPEEILYLLSKKSASVNAATPTEA